MNQIKILVVDDEASVRKLVRSYLEREGFQVTEAADGKRAIDLASSEQPSLVVLDLMLPGVDGLEVCRSICGKTDASGAPAPAVLMLTARAEEADKLVGLGMGADDYLTKPFSPRELVARVKAILRRSTGVAGTETRASSGPAAPGAGGVAESVMIKAGPIEIDPARHEASIDSRRLDLTAREFEILEALAAEPGIVFSRERLLERVWGINYYGDPRVVDVHVAKLRKKLEPDASEPRYLITVRGVGYKLESGG